jgi:hypothetical protein
MFQFLQLCGFHEYSFFKKTSQKEVDSLRSEDREGHKLCPTTQSPENSCNDIAVVIVDWGNSPIQFAVTIFSQISVAIGIVFLQHYGAFHLLNYSTLGILPVINTSCVMKFCYQLDSFFF